MYTKVLAAALYGVEATPINEGALARQDAGAEKFAWEDDTMASGGYVVDKERAVAHVVFSSSQYGEPCAWVVAWLCWNKQNEAFSHKVLLLHFVT